MKLFVQRSRAQQETKDHPIIDPSAFRKWPPGGPRLRNARNLSCLSPTQSGEFDKFQWSEHGPQAIFCQPSPFRPFWGRQNGHSVEGESSRHKMTSAPGRRSGAHSSVQRSTTTIYKNNVTPLGRKRGRIQDSDQHSNRGPTAQIRQRPPAERPRRDEVATHAVTNRTGDGPRGRPGGSGSRWTWRAAVPESPRSDCRNRGSINQWSTKMRAGEGLAQFLRPKRAAHANDASRDRGDGLSARKTVSAVRVPAIKTF